MSSFNTNSLSVLQEVHHLRQGWPEWFASASIGLMVTMA